MALQQQQHRGKQRGTGSSFAGSNGHTGCSTALSLYVMEAAGLWSRCICRTWRCSRSQTPEDS
jgi:hypothetical protein